MLRYHPLCLIVAGALALLLVSDARMSVAADKENQKAKAAKTPAAANKKPGDKKPSRKFLRVTRDKNKRPLAMETSISRYVPSDKNADAVTVDLISAVHIGDTSYYDELNRQFKKYDVVLYELVAPKGTKIPKGGRGAGGSPIGMLQKGMQRMLKLDYQMDRVDYTAKNFVHADMTPEQFAKSMKDRGESFWGMMLKAMMQGMAAQGGKNSVSDVELLMALFDKNRALKLKRIIARQFEDLDGQLQMFSGPDGSTIITERNKVALKVLKKQMAAGKKKIGIFYGAGHFADMEKRLIADFKLRHEGDRWIEAWNLRDPVKKKPAKNKPEKNKPVERPKRKAAEKTSQHNSDHGLIAA
ncbi:MAG: hypothetical protein IIA67_00840 [Planctomycetes bacterium]|nr:hypothetical protein [Planctomycetota bacterium]